MCDGCKCKGIRDDDPRYETLRDFIREVEGSGGAAMPVLQEAQKLFGYLPLEVHKFISKELGIPVAELYGVSTFYSQFNLEPQGKFKIGVCLGTACYVRGAQAVMDKVMAELGIGIGETTKDGFFTLEATRCLGCCSLAPVMMVGDDVYGNLDDISKIPDILDKYREIDEDMDADLDLLELNKL